MSQKPIKIVNNLFLEIPHKHFPPKVSQSCFAALSLYIIFALRLYAAKHVVTYKVTRYIILTYRKHFISIPKVDVILPFLTATPTRDRRSDSPDTIGYP